MIIGQGELIALLLHLLGYLIAVPGGSPIVSRVLRSLGIEEESGVKGAGRIIGMLERVLTLTFMYLNQPTAIAMILLAKSVIRFEHAKERRFAEYYMIGTLCSISIAVLVGVAVTALREMYSRALT